MNMPLSSEEKTMLQIAVIIGCSVCAFFLLLMVAMIGVEAENKQKEDMILQESIGRTIESYTNDGYTIHFHYKNGGGFSIRGHKGLTIK